MEGKHNAHAVLFNELENIIICKYRLVKLKIKKENIEQLSFTWMQNN